MPFQPESLDQLKRAFHQALAQKNTAYNPSYPVQVREFHGPTSFFGMFKPDPHLADEKTRKAGCLIALVFELKDILPGNDDTPMARRNILILNEIRSLITGLSGETEKNLNTAFNSFEEKNSMMLNTTRGNLSLRQNPRFGAYLSAEYTRLYQFIDKKSDDIRNEMLNPQDIDLTQSDHDQIVKDYYSGELKEKITALLRAVNQFQNQINDNDILQENKAELFDRQIIRLNSINDDLTKIPRFVLKSDSESLNNERERIYNTLLHNPDTRAVIAKVVERAEMNSDYLENPSQILREELSPFISKIILLMESDNTESDAFFADVDSHKNEASNAVVNKAQADLLKAEGYPEREKVLHQVKTAINNVQATLGQEPSERLTPPHGPI